MIVKKAKDAWVFAHGKHSGKTFEKVAFEDPLYLNWLFNNTDANKDMPDDVFYLLTDTMSAHSIKFDKIPRRKKTK